MSFDFFGEGIKAEPTAQFTKEQNDFLKAKLPFLDPTKSLTIPIGSALQLMKSSGLKSDIYQKILKNCKIESGKKTLTYDEMKKVFRGIALVQNNIEPSVININANIKTKMPVFDDDQSEQEETVGKVAPIVPTKPTKDSLTEIIIQKQQPEKERSRSPDNITERKQNDDVLTEQQIKEYDSYWATLRTHENRIDGAEVKRLCGNSSNRANLSKAWKLCNLNSRNSLSKGEYFVFLQIIMQPIIPEVLNQAMKMAIAQIDRTSAGQLKYPLPLPAMQASKLFENFGKISDTSLRQSYFQQPQSLLMTQTSSRHEKTDSRNPLSQKQVIPTNVHQQSLSQTQAAFNQQTLNQSQAGTATFNLEALGQTQASQATFSRPLVAHTQIVPSPVPAAIPQTVTNSAINLMQRQRQRSKQVVERSHSLTKQQKTVLQQTQTIKQCQQVLSKILNEFDTFIETSTTRNQQIRSQIDEMRNTQNQLNTRLNHVCVSMKNIIVKQGQYIDELLLQLSNQTNLNGQRVAVLENYVGTVEQQQQNQIIRGNNIQQTSPAQTSPPHTLKSNTNNSQQEHEHQIETAKPAIESKEQQDDHHEQQEAIDDQNRMKMKQMQVIQMIHYLKPITPDEYPAIAQRITSYTEEQLNQAYAGLYAKFLERQKEDEEAAKNSSKLKFPDRDQFNTSNFAGEEQRQQSTNDFFSS